MAEIKRPVLRYHGGKFLLAPWIISHFPKHTHYFEAMGGGGSILMQKPRSRYETYNDLWGTVVNVFRVLRDPNQGKELERMLRLTPYAREEFDACGEINISQVDDPIEKARLTILRSFAGYGSASTNNVHSTGFRTWPRPKGSSPSQDWANYADEIKTFTERLRGVTIENRDYKELLSMYDGPDTLIYLDPPYPHITRNMKRGNAVYSHDFTDADHIEMAGLVREIKSMVVISGYDCDLYKELFGNWHMVRKATLADGGRPRTESLWLNEAAYRGMPKKELFT
jgi:DNA adenine methylase